MKKYAVYVVLTHQEEYVIHVDAENADEATRRVREMTEEVWVNELDEAVLTQSWVDDEQINEALVVE